MIAKSITSISLLLILNSLIAKSQSTDTLTLNKKTNYISATFLSTRIINGHSVETIRKKQLDFRISHRFGQLNEGIDQFYGLDHGVIHLSLEYGITNWLEFGIGRSTFEKTVDGYLKATLFRQSSGIKNMPVHVTYLASSEWITLKSSPAARYVFFGSRLSYIQQLLIARKFNERISLQIASTFIHRNQVPTALDKNDLYSIGGGARYKVTRWVAISAEYFWVYRPNVGSLPTKYYNPLSIGVDIDTGGGHVFQIMLTNSQAMREGGFIGKTTGSWNDGGIHLGFNISRLFSFAKD